MKHLKIESLKELKQWNTENKNKSNFTPPIVLDWFMDYFFDEAIPLGIAQEAYEIIIDFCSICEKMSQQDAKRRVMGNILFWNDRASKYKDAELESLGITRENLGDGEW